MLLPTPGGRGSKLQSLCSWLCLNLLHCLTTINETGRLFILFVLSRDHEQITMLAKAPRMSMAVAVAGAVRPLIRGNNLPILFFARPPPWPPASNVARASDRLLIADSG